MRITGGFLGGRRLSVPKTLVRPTQDRVREALFSSLAPRIAGAAVLDLFAGTGALGLEAYSRGAASVTWVERDRMVFRHLRENVDGLCGDEPGLRCVQGEVFRYLAATPDRRYDLVFADPPYAERGDGEVLEKLLRMLGSAPIFAPSGCFVMEQVQGQATPEPPGWRLIRNKAYGKTCLLHYVRTESDPGDSKL